MKFTSAGQAHPESAGTMTITAQLSAVSGLPVTVPITLSGTATSPAEYSLTGSPLTFAPGSTTATLTIVVVDNTLDEDDEAAIVIMGTPTNAVLGTPHVHTAVIFANDRWAE